MQIVRRRTKEVGSTNIIAFQFERGREGFYASSCIFCAGRPFHKEAIIGYFGNRWRLSPFTYR